MWIVPVPGSYAPRYPFFGVYFSSESLRRPLSPTAFCGSPIAAIIAVMLR